MEMLISFKKRNNIWAEFLLSTYFDNVSVQCGTNCKEVILNELSSKAAIYRYFLENSAKIKVKNLQFSAQMLSCEFEEIFQSSLFAEHFWAHAFDDFD